MKIVVKKENFSITLEAPQSLSEQEIAGLKKYIDESFNDALFAALTEKRLIDSYTVEGRKISFFVTSV